MTRHFTTLRTLLAACLLALPAPAALAAQGVTTGLVRGQVTDENGNPLAGAQVSATNTATSFRGTAVTGADGQYAVRLLPPGAYRVTATQIGRAAASATVQVGVGQGATANLRLSPEAVAVVGVTATASRSNTVDATEGGVQEAVSREQIENLPSLGRDFTDFINLSGLVAPDPGTTTGGQFSIAGQRASQTNLLIDGVDANNSFFGENRGGARIPFAFSLESIREFQIITNGYDVEYGSYSGGVVNVVTRGGTNKLEGTAYGNYRSDALTGANFERSEPVDDYSVTQYSARVSGPIVRDKAFFLVSLDGQRRREPQLPVTLSRYGPGGVEENPAVFSDMQRFFQILEQRYGITDAAGGYSPFTTSNDVITLFGRVDWNLGANNRLTLRHNYSNFTNGNEFDAGFDFIYGLSRAEQFRDRSHSFVGELQSILGGNTFNTLRFQFADEGRPRNGNELRPALVVNLTGGERIGYGGTFVSFQNDLDERKMQLIDNLTHVRGDHTLKVGGNLIYTRIHNQFISNGAGEYSFPNLDALEAFQPTSYTRTVRASGGIPVSDFDVTEWALYAQDEWAVTPKLTATFGLRYDVQSFLDAPSRVVDAERAFNVETGIAPTDNNNVSPRLALAYDVRGDGRSVLRGGAGYFYGRVPYVVGGNVAGSVKPVLQLICTGGPDDPTAPPSPAGYGEWSDRGGDNPSGCVQGGSLTGVPTYTFWQPDFEFPETFKANLGYEQAIGRRTSAKLDLLFTRSTKLYTVRNLNLRDTQLTLDNEGGRQIFQPGGIFDPAAGDATANALRSRRNLEFSDVYVNYNDGRSQAYTASLSLEHRFGENSGLTASYTFNRAEDNSSYSCCTASAGFTAPIIGVYGPNDIGGIGSYDRAWGRSNFGRRHTFVFSGNTRLPLGIRLAGIWRLQSGRPWTPEVRGDINGDGVRFNDRPFIFAPEDLPLAATGAAADEQRANYTKFLAQNDCLGDYVGQVVKRNTCEFPWFNQLDLRLSRSVGTLRGQRAELQVDLFNVLNAINSDWGRMVGVFGANQNILEAVRFDAATNRILYRVPASFAREEALGANLLLQFQTQIGLKYYF
jgi:hypothetical protein